MSIPKQLKARNTALQALHHASIIQQALPVLEWVLESELVDIKNTNLIDLAFRAGDHNFVAEAKENVRSSSVAAAIEQLRAAAHSYPGAVPLLITPSMGETGERLCADAKISWVDLRGNASIRGQGLHVNIRGARAVTQQPPVDGINPFSARASRVVHALLSEPTRRWTRAALSKATGLDKGFVTKIVTALINQRYVHESVARGRSRPLTVQKPIVLLDAWSEHYKIQSPVEYGLLGTHDALNTVHRIQDLFAQVNFPAAFSGLAAAAVYTHFGGFRQIDAYLATPLTQKLRHELHVSGEYRGRNIILRSDEWNVQQSSIVEGIRCTSPIITYLDLEHAPERSKEARAELRRHLIKRWT